MATLFKLYITEPKLQEMLDSVRAKGDKGIALTGSIRDIINEYGQNVDVFLEQTKEQQTNKDKKQYYGRGHVFWTDGNVVKGGKAKEEAPF